MPRQPAPLPPPPRKIHFGTILTPELARQTKAAATALRLRQTDFVEDALVAHIEKTLSSMEPKARLRYEQIMAGEAE